MLIFHLIFCNFKRSFECGTQPCLSMKNTVIFAVFLLLITKIPVAGQNQGEQIFKSNCASCHTIGKGRMVGPDLSGVYDKMPTDWLISFIKSSQSMVKAGDPDAVAIFNEFNKIPMPDNALSDDQILSILDYIKSVDQGSQAAVKSGQPSDSTGARPADSTLAAADTAGMAFTHDMVVQGSLLYHGNVPFANGAAPCVSCHNIMGQTFLGGGKLAFDLTRSYTKLGPAGIRGILANPPFPAMKAAIPGALTDEEINDLVALLQSTDDRFANYTVRAGGGLAFFVISFVIALLLFAHVYIFYDNRKIPDTSPGAEIKGH